MDASCPTGRCERLTGRPERRVGVTGGPAGGKDLAGSMLKRQRHPPQGGFVAETITITDNRSGDTVEIPISEGGVSADDFRKFLPGVWFYDPAFMTTAVASSAITYLDGDAGILRYRGYPIEQLAEQSTYLEVAYLLLKGELPNATELEKWTDDIRYHTYVHENFRKRFLDGFHYDAHPMGILVSSLAALSTFYPEAKQVEDPEVRDRQITRLIAKIPTLAAAAHRFSLGLPFNFPNNSLSFTENFQSMMWKMAEPAYEPNPVLTRALEVLFILHADHEQAMRTVAASHADPYSAAAAGAAALYGPRHGGANEQVLLMLNQIGSVENVPAFIAEVKAGKGTLLQGFGHRVYKNFDPRAQIIKKVADQVFEVTGRNPLLDVALKLEEVALSDEYFISRKLYPNVDFYSGLIYQAMGFPVEMFTVLFAIPRTVGWLSHWVELLQQNTKIYRPRQLYIGHEERPYVALDQRS
jgi:citrate synthase